jgi:hypothetical protein
MSVDDSQRKLRTEPWHVTVISLITALAFLSLSTLGMTALREGFEGIRPLVATFAVFCLAIAAMMISISARWLSTKLEPTSPPVMLRSTLWILAVVALSGVIYLFVAAAPGGPPTQDSWGEVIGAVLGLSVGLTALAVLSDRLMWLCVAVGGLALVAASVVV